MKEPLRSYLTPSRSSPLVDELKALFDVIEAGPLADWLTSPVTRRGPKGYSRQALFRVHIASYWLGLPSTAATVRSLQDNPLLRAACALGDDVPSRPTLSRFFAQMTRERGVVRDALAVLTERLRDRLPGFGEHLAVDSTAIHAYSDPDRSPVSDPDSGWIAKAWASGSSKRRWIFGFRLHMVCDATYELPVAMYVTGKSKGSGDVNNLLPLLDQARERFRWFTPTTVSADKGYDSLGVYRGVIEDHGAVPIIPMRGIHPGAKKRRSGTELRTECAIPRESREWKRLYAMRTGIERLFGRAKETRRLERHCYRGIEKVETHCLLSVLTLQAKAVVQIEASESLRQCLRKVA